MIELPLKAQRRRAIGFPRSRHCVDPRRPSAPNYFGRTLVPSLPDNIRVCVINVGIPACKIELFEKDTFETYAATAPSWMANFINGYEGNPYQYLVDMAKLAQQRGVIKGILLHLGESNSNDQEWPNKVKGIYDSLIKDLNLDSKAPLRNNFGICRHLSRRHGFPSQNILSLLSSSFPCPHSPVHKRMTREWGQGNTATSVWVLNFGNTLAE